MADMTRNHNMGKDEEGTLEVMVPPGMKYLAVLNAGTDNTIEIYEGQRSLGSANILDTMYTVQPYQNTTRPVRESQFYTIVWRTGGIVSDSKLLTLIFSQNNLGINFQGGVPGNPSNMTITGDQVGLVKSTQIPAALESGNLKTVVKNTVDTKLVSELPAGTKQIGSVKVDALPDVTVAGVVTTTVNGNVNTNVQNTVKTEVTNIPYVNVDRIVPVHLQQDNIQGIAGGNNLVDSTLKTVVTPVAGYVTEVFIQASNVNVMNIALAIGPNVNPTGTIELLPGDTFKITLVEGYVIKAKTFGTPVQGDTSLNVITVQRAAF